MIGCQEKGINNLVYVYACTHWFNEAVLWVKLEDECVFFLIVSDEVSERAALVLITDIKLCQGVCRSKGKHTHTGIAGAAGVCRRTTEYLMTFTVVPLLSPTGLKHIDVSSDAHMHTHTLKHLQTHKRQQHNVK